MGKKIKLDKFVSGINSSINEYANIPIGDEEKPKALQTLGREMKLQLECDKQEFDKKLSRDRFNNEKAYKEATLGLETLKMKNENELKERELRLAEKRYEDEKEFRKKDTTLKTIAILVPIGTAFITSAVTLIAILSTRRLAYNELKLIYMDEGRPTPNFKDSIKDIKRFIR